MEDAGQASGERQDGDGFPAARDDGQSPGPEAGASRRAAPPENALYVIDPPEFMKAAELDAPPRQSYKRGATLRGSV